MYCLQGIILMVFMDPCSTFVKCQTILTRMDLNVIVRVLLLMILEFSQVCER